MSDNRTWSILCLAYYVHFRSRHNLSCYRDILSSTLLFKKSINPSYQIRLLNMLAVKCSKMIEQLWLVFPFFNRTPSFVFDTVSSSNQGRRRLKAREFLPLFRNLKIAAMTSSSVPSLSFNRLPQGIVDSLSMWCCCDG